MHMLYAAAFHEAVQQHERHGTGARAVTAEEFEAAYAKRSGWTVERLRQFRTVRPCQCGDELCEGWQSISHERAERYDAGDKFP